LKNKFEKIKEKITSQNIFNTLNLNKNEKWMLDNEIINTFTSSSKSRDSSYFTKDRQALEF
jgi:hypothetical protein